MSRKQSVVFGCVTQHAQWLYCDDVIVWYIMWRNVSVGLGVLVYRGCTLECWVLPDDLQWEYISVSNSLLINMTIIVFYCFNFISQNDHSVLF